MNLSHLPSVKKLRAPGPDVVWVHIDKIGKRSGRDWAVQWIDEVGVRHYHTVKLVELRYTLGVTENLRGPRQPRRVLRFEDARVSMVTSDYARVEMA